MCFHVYSDRCTYVCADPECAMERRHPRPFRRIGLNGHDVAPSRIQPTSKHALKYLFSTGCRPSPRVESRDLFKEIFAYRTVDAFSLYYHLSSIYYYLFFPSFYFLYILVFLSKFLKLLLIQYSSLLFSTRLKWRLKFPRFILIVFVLLLLLSLRNNICRKNTLFPISKMSILFSLFQMVS